MTAEDYKELAEKAGSAAEGAEELARMAEKNSLNIAVGLRNQAKQLREIQARYQALVGSTLMLNAMIKACDKMDESYSFETGV